MFRILISTLCTVALCAVALAAPKNRPAKSSRALICYSTSETRERIARHKLLNPLMLLRAAARRNRAQPLRSRLCRRGNLLIYQFVLLQRDGKVLRSYVNARNGKTLVGRPSAPPKPGK